MVRSEYRIQYNNKKEFHYKLSMFSRGIFKAKEINYKHNQNKNNILFLSTIVCLL